ncbi:protein 5NUC-like [Drosophila hydei]|uniref:5'-nucleotidase n=1 Tax=Drosophila hydei TaxID=7224 RepID=A0A6J1LYH2_DROHY|nr:protein 5NUC-like [Drosophila hydei]XP_023172464.2 protein 5NUC-like [Drosophila hydei]XP_023172465.2 protein 5NUC-like [Drosophila hydei]
MRLMFIPVFLMIFGQLIRANSIKSSANQITEFIILHNNDMHARFEQTNKYGSVCNQDDASMNKCFGGFARVAHEVRKYREEANNGGTPVLYLNAGDTFSGTVWFTVFKNQIASAFLNKLHPDVMCLGNHEFDDNIEGLVSFLNAVDFPVVVSNLDYSKEPELVATNKLSNSTILEVNGTKIGIIGYLTPKTKEDYINKVEFREEITSINAEATKLKDQGIKIIIALGHSGYQKDQEIARECPDVDIVIGGHSHTYLDANKPIADKDDTNPEAVRGPYPTTVVQPSGKKVPVVQVFTNSKYLGKLHVQFDADGNLVQFAGSPILLNASVAQEQDMLDLLDVFRPNITAKGEQVIGHTRVLLEGGNMCRLRECNLGNLVADSMVYSRMLENKGGEYWTDAAIALISGGGIRTSINKKADGAITFRDMAETIPFENRLFVTRLSGKTLLNALEHSASVRNKDSNGGFQQLSGLRVEYNYDMAEGHQVTSVLVLCAECKVPSYSKLNESAYYNVVVPEFLMNGGDGFTLIEANNPFTELLGKDDKGALQQYLEGNNLVYTGVEGRIVITKS